MSGQGGHFHKLAQAASCEKESFIRSPMKNKEHHY